MKSTCPKCHADIELDLPDVTEAGTPSACPACRARLFVHRESFGGRANRMASEISCAHCGEPLGPQICCNACWTPYPDLLVTAAGTKRSGSPKVKVKLSSAPFPSGGAQTAKSHQTFQPQQSAKPAAARGISKKQMTTALSVLLLVVLSGVGFMTYGRIKASKAYTESFVKLTYCIHTEQVKSMQACVKKAEDWKLKGGGQGPSPMIGSEDEKDLGLLKTQIETLQAKMPPAPEKYQRGSDLLAALRAPAQKMRGLALNPSPNLSALTDSTTKLDAEYQKTAREFKTNLPPELLEALQEASKRYKGLHTLLGR